MVSNPLIDRSATFTLHRPLNSLIFVLVSSESSNQSTPEIANGYASLHTLSETAGQWKMPHYDDRNSCLATPETYYLSALAHDFAMDWNDRSRVCELSARA